MRSLRRTRRPLVALLALLAALVVGYAVRGAGSDGPGSGTGTLTARSGTGSRYPTRTSLSTLPPQVAQTVRVIRANGPFPYPANDGVVFHNFEHALPTEPDGYYREYTVPTPGSDDRGARRIVVGRNGAYYYTGDHYTSFQRLDLSS